MKPVTPDFVTVFELKYNIVSSLLYKLIQEGEHQKQDFKYCINDSKKIAKTLVAFANTDGGRLLIGVKDNGRIAGVRTEEEYYMIESAAKIYSRPEIEFTTRQWQVEGKTILEIKVEKSLQKPHYAKDETGRWLAYVRVDDENCLAHKIQLNVWKRQLKPVHISISETEKILIDFLQKNDFVSFSKFLRLSHASRLKAEQVLTDFVSLDIVRMHTTKENTSFALNPEYHENTFLKLKENFSGI